MSWRRQNGSSSNCRPARDTKPACSRSMRSGTVPWWSFPARQKAFRRPSWNWAMRPCSKWATPALEFVRLRPRWPPGLQLGIVPRLQAVRPATARSPTIGWSFLATPARATPAVPFSTSGGRLVGVLWGTDGEEVVAVQAGRLHLLLDAAVPVQGSARLISPRAVEPTLGRRGGHGGGQRSRAALAQRDAEGRCRRAKGNRGPHLPGKSPCDRTAGLLSHGPIRHRRALAGRQCHLERHQPETRRNLRCRPC